MTLVGRSPPWTPPSPHSSPPARLERLVAAFLDAFLDLLFKGTDAPPQGR
jgi:hypothetical protein